MLQAETTEARFYQELTQFLSELKHLPLTEIEAEIERRFRLLLRASCAGNGRTLHVTFTWTLPEGADGWAMYGTACAVRPDTDVSRPPLPLRTERLAPSRDCQVIPFPKAPVARLTPA